MKIKPEITWDDFEKLDLRIGTITEVTDFKKAKKPAFKLTIDFGSQFGIRKSSAQITDLYSADELLGTQVMAVVNFPPKQIANFMSECLVMGVYSEKGVVLLQPNKVVKNGALVG